MHLEAVVQQQHLEDLWFICAFDRPLNYDHSGADETLLEDPCKTACRLWLAEPPGCKWLHTEVNAEALTSRQTDMTMYAAQGLPKLLLAQALTAIVTRTVHLLWQ